VQAEFGAVLASIPSPGTGTIDLGPLTLHMYGLMLLLAIAVCVVLTGLRRTRRFLWRPDTDEPPDPDWDLTLRTAVWGVGAGIVGARAYHVITSWDEVPDPKWRGVFEVWEGGLGVWGGIALGALVGCLIVRRAGRSPWVMLDAAAPGLLLAHGIGRFGNWWNQELFGKPTDLPWGLEIDLENRPTGYLRYETFHPTFLYEFVYVTLMALVLIAVGYFFRIRPPALFALYVAMYTFGRFFEELLRVDPSHEIAGLRLNAWLSIILFVASVAFFLWWQRPLGGRRGRRRAERPRPRGPAMAIPRKRVRSSR
jgi:phosphatidylglycerol---prolipoprotein diacylglyceryl transferase